MLLLKQRQNKSMNVVKLGSEHIPCVAEIERLCFSSPWSPKSLEMLTGDGGIGFVAICEGHVVAYGGMMTVLDEGQVTNIATHPDFRRKGAARAVTEALAEYGRKNGVSTIYLEVRISNGAAIALYEGCGFFAVGERKKFYSDPIEDAVIMKKILVE